MFIKIQACENERIFGCPKILNTSRKKSFIEIFVSNENLQKIFLCLYKIEINFQISPSSFFPGPNNCSKNRKTFSGNFSVLQSISRGS